jgi:hypothetical protein
MENPNCPKIAGMVDKKTISTQILTSENLLKLKGGCNKKNADNNNSGFGDKRRRRTGG